MPELPEVETTRLGITPLIEHQTIEKVIVRQAQLRWPVPKTINGKCKGQSINRVARRGKYLLLKLEHGTVIMHLGMSGSLRVIACRTPADKHDHVDFVLSNGQCLRLRDPRRFGAVLYTNQDPYQHKLLKDLGPEPLSREFNSEYLYKKSRKRQLAIKSFIMDSRIVVGVGNIYASEALFKAGVHPKKVAGKVTSEQYKALTKAIKSVLKAAIKAGGTTIRDFSSSDGRPGYFTQSLKVYGRKGLPCPTCGKPISHSVIGQRATYYCTHCQK
jgi:formamidopyrimidine-DNA glycosylase